MIIQLLGAAGSGKSTLGRAISSITGLPLLQSDRYLWQDDEFTRMRPPEEARSLLRSDLERYPNFILDGGVHRWLPMGALRPDLLVLIRLEHETRMARLRQRELDRFGDRCLPGGDHAPITQEFLDWAATYETASYTEESNCLASHLRRLGEAECPCLILWSRQPAEHLARQVLSLAGYTSSI